MPVKSLEVIAKKSGLSIDKVEKYWDKAKKIAKEKFKETDDAFWPYVMGILKRMAGVSEMKAAERLLEKYKVNEEVTVSSLDAEMSKLESAIEKELKDIKKYRNSAKYEKDLKNLANSNKSAAMDLKQSIKGAVINRKDALYDIFKTIKGN